MAESIDRKLTTVLCADVCGYSRMMDSDEEGTLQSLKRSRTVFQNHISEHGGRIVNMTGDGLMAEFSSVVKSLQCAVEIQNQLNKTNQKIPDDEQMHFRIGLNLGDVMIEQDDIFGEGVNVASRLEALATPGGICISGTVYDHVKNKIPLGFNFLGDQKVKNIVDAVPVYTVTLGTQPSARRGAAPEPKHQSENSSTDPEEEEIRVYVKKVSAFYRRSFRMGAVVIFLFLINMLSSPTTWWFYWPALPIIFVIAMDALRVFGKGEHGREWEEKQVARIKAQQKRRNS